MSCTMGSVMWGVVGDEAADETADEAADVEHGNGCTIHPAILYQKCC